VDLYSMCSPAGQAFLKCAFASPDFSVDPGMGIPDKFHGRTLGIKDCSTTGIVFTPNTDTYIVSAPVPGFAYFKCEVPIGDDPLLFVGVPFPTFNTNFGDGSNVQNNFSKFRYASLAVGLYPTTNQMRWGGNLSVWRVDLNLAESVRGPDPTPSAYGLVQKRIQGLQGVVPLVPRDNLSHGFINGAFTYAFDKSTDFEWQDFCEATSYTADATGTNIITSKRLISSAGTRLPGMGNLNSIVMKITTGAEDANSATLKVWNCMELQPDTQSALYQYSGISPGFDPVALELYSKLKMQFPVAVPSSMNEGAWKRVLALIRDMSGLGAMIPGGVGMISAGIHGVTRGIESLFM